MANIRVARDWDDAFRDRQDAINYLISKGVITGTRTCHICGNEMKIKEEKDVLGRYVCYKKRDYHDKITVARANYSFFSKLKLKPYHMISYIYSFIKGDTPKEAGKEGRKIGKKGNCHSTATRYYKKLREVCQFKLNNMYDRKIGGPGCVVEVDETFIRNKCNSYYILGMKDRNSNELRLENLWGYAREKENLHYYLRKHIHEESIVVTDGWRGYIGINEYFNEHVRYIKEAVGGVRRQTYNNRFDRDEDREILETMNTNHIEAEWRLLKQKVKCFDIDKVDEHLCEYLWKKEVEKHKYDGVDYMFECIKEVRPPKETQEADEEFQAFIASFHYGIKQDQISRQSFQLRTLEDISREDEFDEESINNRLGLNISVLEVQQIITQTTRRLNESILQVDRLVIRDIPDQISEDEADGIYEAIPEPTPQDMDKNIVENQPEDLPSIMNNILASTPNQPQVQLQQINDDDEETNESTRPDPRDLNDYTYEPSSSNQQPSTSGYIFSANKRTEKRSSLRLPSTSSSDEDEETSPNPAQNPAERIDLPANENAVNIHLQRGRGRGRPRIDPREAERRLEEEEKGEYGRGKRIKKK